ncbi:MAG TPA: type II toxin-antitoxin system prevent-host-death family antitoxin [bacterium]|jgi:prevent-host-death family protein
MEVSVRELKNHLSEYLRRMQAGEVVVVTSRGKPLAQLMPVTETPDETEAAAVERFRGQPWVRPAAGGKPEGARNPIPWQPGQKKLSDLVLEDRE